MEKSTRNILDGIGSILNIMPTSKSSDYSRFVPKDTDEARMSAIWQQVGNDLKTAMELYSGEQKTKEIHP